MKKVAIIMGSDSDLAVMQPEGPASLKEHYRAMKANAADCNACGECEARCPFGVSIVERMMEANRTFQ